MQPSTGKLPYTWVVKTYPSSKLPGYPTAALAMCDQMIHVSTSNLLIHMRLNRSIK